MLVEILWIVFFVLGLIFFWPGAPLPNYPWAPHLYYMLMFGLTGLVLFDGLGHLGLR